MKLICTIACLIGFSSSAIATPVIRVPVVLEGWEIAGSKRHVFSVPDVASELAARGLTLPEHILIGDPSQQEALSQLAYDVTDAGIGKAGIDSALAIVTHRRMVDYEVKGRESICYVADSTMSLRENAENALALYSILDTVLSSDYSMIGARFFDESLFDEDDFGGNFSTADLNATYSGVSLEPGAVQIIITRNPHGLKATEEILAPCK